MREIGARARFIIEETGFLLFDATACVYIYTYVARVSDEPPNRGYLNKCRKLPHSRLVAMNKYVRNCIKKRSQWIYVFVLDFTPVRRTICINSLLDVFLFSRNSRVAGVAWFAG